MASFAPDIPVGLIERQFSRRKQSGLCVIQMKYAVEEGEQLEIAATDPNQQGIQYLFKSFKDASMAALARDYHTDLQTDPSETDAASKDGAIEDVLRRTKKPDVLPGMEELSKELTEDDVLDSLKDSAIGKAPGTDGLHTELWTKLHSIFTHTIFLHSDRGCAFFNTLKNALRQIIMEQYDSHTEQPLRDNFTQTPVIDPSCRSKTCRRAQPGAAVTPHHCWFFLAIYRLWRDITLFTPALWANLYLEAHPRLSLPEKVAEFIRLVQSSRPDSFHFVEMTRKPTESIQKCGNTKDIEQKRTSGKDKRYCGPIGSHKVGTTELELSPSDLDKFWNVRVPDSDFQRPAKAGLETGRRSQPPVTSLLPFTWITSLISIMPPADKQDGVRKKERVKKMGQQAVASQLPHADVVNGTPRRHARAATSRTHVGTLEADFSMCHIQDSPAGRVSVMLPFPRPIVPRGIYVGAT
ncbi:hypothetical protein C8J57DRAFT_1223088 [Mycena rebaudengoi]|nr:hypothetical protein C8J57DRAFT_1223088 [Mycena rebaudengoi]